LSNDIYSGTYRFFTGTLARYGIITTLVDFNDLDATEEAISAKTRLVWVETPTNPNLKVTDIAAVAAISKAAAALLVVDNTFVTSCLLVPAATPRARRRSRDTARPSTSAVTRMSSVARSSATIRRSVPSCKICRMLLERCRVRSIAG
jgi:hypothetical protein